jgi:Cd2+/Zn2+-exporting ATPase
LLLTGILLVLAWGISLIAPNEMKPWPFVGACLVGLFPVARRALASLRVAQPFSIEALMMIAAIGALFIGAAQEAALVVFLFAVGELLEGVAVSHARDGIRALGALVLKIALREDTAGIREVPAVELRLGDVVLVRPGDRIPADGEIISGVSGIDESPVTGESVPVSRGPTDAVFAGSVNTEAALRVRVTRTAADNTISRIIHLVEQAEEARAPTQRFIDRFSRWACRRSSCFRRSSYASPTGVCSGLVGLGLSRVVPSADWLPCALVISVPAAIASALALGAHNGLLIKGGAVIEATARVKTVALDKTGTLTLGRPDVTDIIVLDSLPETQVLAVAAAVEGASSHPLAQAILRRAQSNGPGIDIPVAQESRAIPGRGVTGRIDGMDFTISSPLQAVRDGALSATDTARATELRRKEKPLPSCMVTRHSR